MDRTHIEDSAYVVAFRLTAAVLCPPLSVWSMAEWSEDFILSIMFTICGFFPGIIHAIYLIKVYYDRQSMSVRGELDLRILQPKFLVMSPKILRGYRKIKRPAHGHIQINLGPIAAQITQTPNQPEDQSKTTVTHVAEGAVQSAGQGTPERSNSGPSNTQNRPKISPIPRSVKPAPKSKPRPGSGAASV